MNDTIFFFSFFSVTFIGVNLFYVLNFQMKKQNQEELLVLELNAGDSVRDAVHLLYKENVSGAPIADLLDTDATIGRFSDRYIGFIDFASIILWSLEVYKFLSLFLPFYYQFL